MFIKENVFKTQSSKYHPTHVYKTKNSRTKAGPGPPGPTPKSTLVVPLCAGGVTHFAVKSSRLYKSPKSQVVYCNFELAT